MFPHELPRRVRFETQTTIPATHAPGCAWDGCESGRRCNCGRNGLGDPRQPGVSTPGLKRLEVKSLHLDPATDSAACRRSSSTSNRWRSGSAQRRLPDRGSSFENAPVFPVRLQGDVIRCRRRGGIPPVPGAGFRPRAKSLRRFHWADCGRSKAFRRGARSLRAVSVGGVDQVNWGRSTRGPVYPDS